MTFNAGDPGHVAEHNNLRASLNSTDANVALRVTKGELVINVADQVGVTDDLKIDAAILAASLSVGARTIFFPARAYVVNAEHLLTSLSDLTLEFEPGSTVRPGPTAAGNLLTLGRIFTLTGCSRVTIQGLRVLAPATPMVATVGVEVCTIQISGSSNCVVRDSILDVTNTWAVSNTYFDASTGLTIQYCPSGVFIKGPSCTDNRVQDCSVTGGPAVVYAYGGATRTTVTRVTSTNSPGNGFAGIGNGAGWSEDCLLDQCHVVSSGRIGIEDWNKIRRTVVRDCTVISAAHMGMSCVATAPRLINPYVEGTPTYTGLELGGANTVVTGGRIIVGAATTNGIVVDGNTAIGNGDLKSSGARIVNTEVYGGLSGISLAGSINPGQVVVTGCSIRDWVRYGIELSSNSAGTLPAVVSNCYLENSVPSVATPAGFRVGVQGNTGARFNDIELRVLAAASGGVGFDIPVHFAGNDQVFRNIRVDGGSVVSPGAPTVGSIGGVYTGVIVDGLYLTGGATATFQYLTSPVIANIVGTVATIGSGGAGTSPIKLNTSGGVAVWSGTGTPESVVTAAVGSMYFRRDGGAATSLYVKESGAGNTGWIGYNSVSSLGGTLTGLLALAAGAAGVGGVTIGADANLYRSGANALQSDSTLQVLRAGFGTAPNATAPVAISRTVTAATAITVNVVGDANARIQLKTDGSMLFGDGTATPDTNVYRSAANVLSTDDDLRVATVGKCLLLAEGSNAKAGVATLVGGTVVVSTTAVTANSRIHLTAQALGTVAIPSALAVSARTASTSFTILANQVTDTSTVYWSIIEPS